MLEVLPSTADVETYLILSETSRPIIKYEPGRSSVAVITRLEHKDDSVAQKAAYLISKHLKEPVCVIAGVHVDNLTRAEISKIL